MPVQKGWRREAQVDGDIEDAASQTAHELGFRMRRRLKVQPAERAGQGCQGMIDLDDAARAYELRQFGFTVKTREGTALVRE
jgi:hypothetical protein